jgi:CBS domain-containing protein
MRAHDLMTTRVHTVHADDPLSRAAQLMWDHDCGGVPVVDADGHVVAMLTDRDVCMAAYTRGRPLTEMTVVSAMSKKIYSVKAEEPIESVERLMWSTQVRRVPVTDDCGRLIGLLSLSDIARRVRELPGCGSNGWSTESEACALARTLAAISERPPL